MKRKIKKSAPVLIVGAILGFLCWSYIDSTIPRPKDVDAKTALATLVEWLSPGETAPPQRDPFDSRAAVMAGRKRKGDKAAKPLTAAGGPSQTAGTPGAAAAVAARALPRPSDLALQATHLRNDRRIALINGIVYAEGDEIKSPGPSATTYKVTRIYPHRVELESESLAHELTYPAHNAKPLPRSSGTARDNPDKTKTNGKNTRKTT